MAICVYGWVADLVVFDAPVFYVQLDKRIIPVC